MSFAGKDDDRHSWLGVTGAVSLCHKCGCIRRLTPADERYPLHEYMRVHRGAAEPGFIVTRKAGECAVHVEPLAREMLEQAYVLLEAVQDMPSIDAATFILEHGALWRERFDLYIRGDK